MSAICRVNCCADGCFNTKRKTNLSFFTLPTDCERRNQWLNLIGRPDLLKKADLKSSSYRVCSEHFEESMILEVPIKKLLPHAVPTIFGSMQTQPQPSTSNVKIEQDAFDTSTQIKDLYGNVISVVKIKDATTAVAQTQTEEPQKENKVQTVAVNTPRKRKLLTNFQEPERKKTRLGCDLDNIETLKTNLLLSLNIPSDDDDGLTKTFQTLINCLNSIKNKYKGNKLNTDFKFFALNLHFASPQTYRSLKSILKLPNECTLSRLKLNIQPKLEDYILNAVATKMQSLPDAAKYCTICVDVMILKRHLYYDIRHDEVVGLHNINGNVTNEIASNAYVVMLQGIAVNWKQPIAYSLLASAKHYEELDDWINKIISKLLSLGIIVKAIVSDQGSNFDKYVRVKKVTFEKPYFTIGEHKIYYIFAVPHLLNCIRNNLLTNDFNCEGKIITWDYIKKLNLHQKEQNLSLIPKITNAHIDPNYDQKIQVKYATQIFSQSVHGVLNTLIFAKLLPEEAKATSEFVKLLNDLFDILNSSKIKSNNKYQQAFNLNKDQLEVLGTAQNMFKNIISFNKIKGIDNTNKTFKNFLISIQSIFMVSKDLKKEGLNFILTRRLNKDPLEKLFGAIRQQVGNCREPTPIQFRRAFSKLFITNLLKNSPSSNCQEDLCDLLSNGNKMLSEVMSTAEDRQKANETSMRVSLNGVDDYAFDLPTENAITYVAGYFLFKCSQQHHCSKFKTFVRNSLHLKDTHFKEFNKKLFLYKNLKVPPKIFVNYVNKMESNFLNFFRKAVLQNPANTLINFLQNINFPKPCPCFPSEYILKLFVRFRIYAAIKLNNRYLRKEKNHVNHYIKVKPL